MCYIYLYMCFSIYPERPCFQGEVLKARDEVVAIEGDVPRLGHIHHACGELRRWGIGVKKFRHLLKVRAYYRGDFGCSLCCTSSSEEIKPCITFTCAALS